MLGPDGRPFNTRAGQTVRLTSLLEEAVDRARTTVADKDPDLSLTELDHRARQVGIGAAVALGHTVMNKLPRRTAG